MKSGLYFLMAPTTFVLFLRFTSIFPSSIPRFSLHKMPNAFDASKVSFLRNPSSPRVLNSASVKSRIPIFLFALTRLMMVPPQFSSTSSGWLPKNNASRASILVNLISANITIGKFELN